MRLTSLLSALLLASMTLSATTAYSYPATDLSAGMACIDRVIDGDTVHVQGLDHNVRLAGIDAPELAHPDFGIPEQRGAREADAFMLQMVGAVDCWVWVQPATPSWDEGTQRYRAWIFADLSSPVGPSLLQAQMVSEGWAFVDYGPYAPDAYLDELNAAQASARAEGRGLWGIPPNPMPTPSMTAESAPCYTGQVKGNLNSGIYHVPGGEFYARTRSNVACFDSEADAQAAGFRRSLR